MTLFPNDFRSAQEKYAAFQPFFRVLPFSNFYDVHMNRMRYINLFSWLCRAKEKG